MTKWNLPEGRKPLTDGDMAALTRRLADTAIEHSELYQAAKRDAEEAEAYAAELEAKLAKAVEFTGSVVRYAGNCGDDYLAEQARAALLARIEEAGEATASTTESLTMARVEMEKARARAEKAEALALPEVRALLQEAREDLAAYVDEDYPPTSRAKYPDIQRRWHRDMELCRRIDAALDAAQEGEG